jgi:hypothetical protein
VCRSFGQAPGKIDADDSAADVAREETPLASRLVISLNA